MSDVTTMVPPLPVVFAPDPVTVVVAPVPVATALRVRVFEVMPVMIAPAGRLVPVRLIPTAKPAVPPANKSSWTTVTVAGTDSVKPLRGLMLTMLAPSGMPTPLTPMPTARLRSQSFCGSVGLLTKVEPLV